MDKGFDSWFRDQQTPNVTSGQFGLGPRVSVPSFGNMVSPKATTRQEQQPPCGWFYGLPRYRQGLINPVVNAPVKEQLPVVGPGPDVTQARVNGVEKKFLVFDQSGDQTTLIYSSGVGTAPTRYQYSSLNNNPKPQYGSYPGLVDETIKEDNNGNDSSSEMREDTEELNALLYSDDDEENEYNSENEETSTGHSPSSMIRFGEQKLENVIGEEEEVASSGGPTKRRKLEDDGKIITSLEDTASSGKSGIYCSGNDGNGVYFEEEFSTFSCGNKRLRIEKMKETINLIQNLIPGDKNGKNAIMVIDEAIQYLINLKAKAKALGLDSL